MNFEDGKKKGNRKLQELEMEDEWLMWVRGLKKEIWEKESVMLREKYMNEDLKMGIEKNRKVEF
ncbi:hypothetical protein E3A20_28240 [Planctomyces bekefii]|uniref:Uncharacterized protein n=1 Tax=Planctomyces bekefii TaxID=1653850 RepID=A0A5C6M147_9PLAN|nr:hypothetical protein E3A20_28240 [Planctomyces bekefii]